jgi:hypothetical protein
VALTDATAAGVDGGAEEATPSVEPSQLVQARRATSPTPMASERAVGK